MKRFKSEFYLLLMLVVGLVSITSCSKDDEEEPDAPVVVGDIMNFDFSVHGGNVFLDWSEFDGAQAYMVFIGGVSDSDSPITETSYNAGSIVDGMELKVEAYKTAAMKTCIGRAIITYDEPVMEKPDPISNLEVVEEGDGYVILKWTNPESDFDWIEIYDGPKEQGVELATTGSNSISEIKVVNLTNDQEYDFHLYTRLVQNPQDKQYSDAVVISAIPTDGTGGGDDPVSLDGTIWEYKDDYSSEYDMRLSFSGDDSVILNDGSNHYLSYTYDPETRKGVIDPGGYYEDDFTVSYDYQSLECYSETFTRLMK